MLGAVHTVLLKHSTAMSQEDVVRILDVVLGEPVRRSQRPIQYAVSPERFTGVDCDLPTGSGSRLRAIGTVASSTAVTGGHVLQCSAYTVVEPGGRRDRMPWSHYLARPGHLVAGGDVEPADIAAGHVGSADRHHVLDLGSIADRALDNAQRSPLLDRKAPLQTQRTRWRWAAWPADVGGTVSGALSIRSETARTLALRVPDVPVEWVAELCRDLAMHDWLVTTLVRYLEQRLGAYASPGEIAARLRPAFDHLLHLWMPAARVAEPLMPVWDALERRPGFTRQWEASVRRIRDHVYLGTTGTRSSDGNDNTQPPSNM